MGSSWTHFHIICKPKATVLSRVWINLAIMMMDQKKKKPNPMVFFSPTQASIYHVLASVFSGRKPDFSDSQMHYLHIDKGSSSRLLKKKSSIREKPSNVKVG